MKHDRVNFHVPVRLVTISRELSPSDLVTRSVEDRAVGSALLAGGKLLRRGEPVDVNQVDLTS